MHRASLILSLPILFTTLATPATHAAPVTVVVGGNFYDVDYFTGSWQNNQGLFTTADMPWWNNQPLAEQFAAAVGNKLGSVGLGGTTGPLFANFKNSENDIVYVAYNITEQNTGFAKTGPSDSQAYAKAQQSSGPVIPEIDALASTGALTLLGCGLALAGERRRRA